MLVWMAMTLRLVRALLVWLITMEARLALALHAPRIVAVTGNLGKTSTKDAIFACVSPYIRTRKSMKSFNSDIGVPLAILALPNPWSSPTQWIVTLVRGLVAAFNPAFPPLLVLELGADQPGDIATIAPWLAPDIDVFTGVPSVPVHVENFGSREMVLKEKRALFEHLKPGGTIVAVNDDSTREMLAGIGAKVVTYGFGEADVAASAMRIEYEHDFPVGVSAEVRLGGVLYTLQVRHALGKPKILAALAAVAVADALGIDVSAAVQSVSAWEPPAGRMRLVLGVNGSLILDDSYNASPAATLSALDTLADVRATRRIAVLGDMLELGVHSEDAHLEVGRLAACCDVLVVVGTRARGIADGARNAGLSEEKIHSYDAGMSDRAGSDVAKELRAGDVVLVKGSQGMRMERAVFEMMQDKADAEQVLVRHDAVWRDIPTSRV